jgi:hypothetical protein
MLAWGPLTDSASATSKMINGHVQLSIWRGPGDPGMQRAGTMTSQLEMTGWRDLQIVAGEI